ncbi:MAG: ABC transporter permease subunit, partial [Phormidesmis sp. CAN_BIN44]|nr:ABC transporter permease subunit [Phormidesmis sp. CAN_BIN44]
MKFFASRFKSAWVKRLLILGGLILVYGWALRGLKLDLEMLNESVPYTIDFISRLLPPDWSVIDVAVNALVETIQMSLWGTTIGALLSVPIAILSAHNLTPSWVRWIANLVQNAVRSVPSIVLGLFFVSATGLGAPAGTLALGIYTIGYLAKLYQEAIESVD